MTFNRTGDEPPEELPPIRETGGIEIACDRQSHSIASAKDVSFQQAELT